MDVDAVDLGGPRRELLRLLVEALVLSPLFEGRDIFWPWTVLTSLRDDLYFLAGGAVAMTFDLQVNKEPKMVAGNEVPMLVVLTSVCTLCVLIVSTLWTCLKIVRAVRPETQETYTLYPEQEQTT
ncbi:G2/M phase-specific E3 ubiquitin-protein ligase-like, partial [Tachysurus ichikawai]